MYMKYFSFSITINLFCDGYKFLCRIITFVAGTRAFFVPKMDQDFAVLGVCVCRLICFCRRIAPTCQSFARQKTFIASKKLKCAAQSLWGKKRMSERERENVRIKELTRTGSRKKATTTKELITVAVI